MTRDERQEIIVNKWIDNDYMGGVQAVTGFGKSRTSILGIKKSNSQSTSPIVQIIKISID